MRSEKEILDLILNTARDDYRIRAVMMNGSRANPNAPKDIFQDFDIIYFVTEPDPFTLDHTWINRFGELMILQMPDTMGAPPPGNNPGFTYLMQFMDGNRIDLNIFPIDHLNDLEKDSLSLVLLDKDNLFHPLAPPSESDYLPIHPTAKAFADCCNEFWWVSPYVAKGLWREEITYAKFMLDQVVRDQLMEMLNWYVGVRTGFSRNPGKFGKYLQHYIEPELWDMLQKTYSDAGYAATWEALDVICALFRITAVRVAAHFDFEYPHGDDERVSAHLHHVRFLPKNAKTLY
ncbi:MAG TPA: aminoglycoside 6-adenylyltransferase [Anaerolineales bacterium]|jgi:aminoglycoside 6-adenylyltransferase